MAVINTKDVVSGTLSATPTTKKAANNDLGKDQFLNLLTSQLKNQDPLAPTDNSQMMAQLAQFSSLEQMQNLNQSFDKYQGIGMIGKIVQGSDSSTKTDFVGQVMATKIVDGSPLLEIQTTSGNAQEVKLSDVTYVGS